MHIHSKFSHFFLSVRQPYKPNVQSPFGFALTLLRGFSDDIVPSELSTQPWNMTSSLSLLLSVTPLSPHRLKLCHSDFLSVSYLQIYYDFFLCVLHWPPRISYRAPNNGRRSPWRDCAQLSIPQPHVRDCRYRRRRRRGAIETEVRQEGTDGHSLQSARGAVKFCFPVKYVHPPHLTTESCTETEILWLHQWQEQPSYEYSWVFSLILSKHWDHSFYSKWNSCSRFCFGQKTNTKANHIPRCRDCRLLPIKGN